MTRTDEIRHTLSSTCIPDHIKLFIFGLFRQESGDTAENAAIRKPRIPRTHRKTQMNFGQIEQKLQQWTDATQNMSRNPNLDELAEDLHVERDTLLAFFSKYMKQDFRTWKARMKITKARALLLDANKAPGINEVAGLLGFRDKSNFHRIFKKYSGCTPGEWKESGGHPSLDK